jgi:thioredoxin-like negative regulator of GroEL
MIVIKKFEKPNCYPCRVLDTYLSEYDFDSLGVALEKVNIDDLPDGELERLNIRSVPTLIFYRNGHEMARLVGLKSMDEFEDCLRQAKEGR